MVSFGSAIETFSGATELKLSKLGAAPAFRLMIQAVPLQESESVSPETMKPSGTGEPLQTTRFRSCANDVIERSKRKSEALNTFMREFLSREKVGEMWAPRDCGNKTIGSRINEVNRFFPSGL
jgi:hypothetical protein